MSSSAARHGRAVATLCLTTLALGALLACKLGKKEEAPEAGATAAPPTDLSPTPEPTTPAPTPPDTAAAPGTPAPNATTPRGATPKATTTTATASATATTTTTATASATTPPAPTASTTATATATATASHCAPKCQGVLTNCLKPATTDGGLPTLADPTACQKAFNDCVAACSAP